MSVTLNALKKFLSFKLDKPDMTTIANIKVNPLTKLQNKIEKISVISNKSTFIFSFNYDVITLYNSNKFLIKTHNPT